MKNFFKAHGIDLLLSFGAIIFMWLVWIVSALIVKNEYVIPTFSSAMKEVFTLFGEKFFWQSFFNTLYRTLIAVVISFVTGGFLAVLGYVFKPVAKFLKTIIAFIRTLPTMAVILLILIWTTPNIAPIIVAILVLFPMIYTQFFTALNGIDDGLINAIKVFKISKKDIFFKIYIPQVAPDVLTHLGANFSFGIKLIVSAEVMAFTFKGLGGMLQLANVYVNTARLSALTIVTVLTGIIIEIAFYLIFKNAFKWKREEV